MAWTWERLTELQRMLATVAGVGLQEHTKHTKFLYQAAVGAANLAGARLSHVDFSSADLRGARLDRADLRKTNLQSTRLESAALPRANLSWAEARGVDLRWAVLEGCDLTEAVLA